MQHDFQYQGWLGEVRLPTACGRLLLEIVEPSNPTEALADARLALYLFRRDSRRRQGIKHWLKLRRQEVVMHRGTLELINLTRWKAEQLEIIIGNLCRHLRLRRQVRFLFQESWTILDEETGEIVLGSENPDVEWDGDAWKMNNGGLVRLCLSPAIKFPVVWDINRELPGRYLRSVTWFQDAEEMFLFMAAHELRHLWQFEHEKKARQIRRILDMDDETDADLYALRVLSDHRVHDRPWSKGRL